MAQLAPVRPAPLAHVHSFTLHWRSDVDVFATDSYWASVHSLEEAHVPHPLCSREYGTDRYWSPEHVLTALHTRLLVIVGATVWHVTPSVHAV